MVSYGSVRSVEREGLELNRVRNKALLAGALACIATVCLLGTVWFSSDVPAGNSLLEYLPRRYAVQGTPSWMAPMLSQPMMYAMHRPSSNNALAQQLASISDIPSKFDSEDPQELKREADEVEAAREDLEREDEQMRAKQDTLSRHFHAIREERRAGRSPPRPARAAVQAPPKAQQQAQTAFPPAPQEAVTEPVRQEEEEEQPRMYGQQQRVESAMRWNPTMGTDISFIKTADFPRVMESSWHTRAETEQAQAQANQREAQIADSKLRRTVQSQAAQLAAQQQEIRELEQQQRENREEEEERFYSQPPPAAAPRSALAHQGFQPSETQRKAPTQQLRSTSGSLWPWKGDGMSQFQKELSGFLGSTTNNNNRLGGLGGLEVAQGQQKVMTPGGQLPLPDQRKEEEAQEEAEEEGELAGEEAAEEEWEHPEQEGGPCNWPGACNRGKFEGKKPGHWASERNERFMTPEEIEKMEAEEAEEDKMEEEEAEQSQDAKLKSRWEDRIFGGSMDDFVPTKDAQRHNLLTTGVYGVDHFGKFAPFSKENNEVMYGRFYKITTNALGEPSQTAKGNLPGVNVGEDGGKIGGADSKVALKDASPKFPTAHPEDRFADWEHDSEKNQRMLHGRYWKELKRDGFGDRFMPAAEAEKQHNGGGNDRNAVDHVMDWTMYAPEERQRVHGDKYAEHAFTGTDESVEERKGTVGSGTPFFKVSGADANVLRQLPQQQQRVVRFMGYPTVQPRFV